MSRRAFAPMSVFALLVFASACTSGIGFISKTHYQVGIGVKEGGGSWHGPVALDKGEFSGAMPSKTFSDFVLTGDSDRALLVAGFHDGTAFRAWGRHYLPVSEDGEGWADGDGDRIIDENSTPIDARSFAVGFRPGNSRYESPDDALVVMGDSASAANTQSMLFRTDSSWAFNELNVCAALPPYAINSSGIGRTSGAAWDSDGRAYYGFISDTGMGGVSEFRVQRYSAFSGWEDPAGIGQLVGSPSAERSVKMIADGFGVTALWLGECGWGSCVRSASSWEDDFGVVDDVSSEAAVIFDAATDGKGTVVAAFIEEDSSITGSCLAGATNCKRRLFGAIRTAAGGWSPRMRLDDGLSETSASYFQDSGAEGITYATPVVGYLGSGTFLVVFGLSNFESGVTGIYARRFIAGTGWVPGTEVLYSAELEGASLYRHAYDLRIATDRGGKATIVTNLIETDAAANADRYLGLGVIRYTLDGGLKDRTALSGSGVRCPADDDSCRTRRFETWMFDSGEIVVVYEGPASSGSAAMRLYSMEFY